jgi:hypothetical protein
VGAVLVCLATSSYLRARRSIGGSGADQLRFIVLVVVGLVWAAGWTPTARYLGDLFLAAQVALAYFTAGVAKAVSATWRSGRPMTAILYTEGYGTRAFGDLLSRHPGLDRTICAGVIAWEVTFPLVFVLPTPGQSPTWPWAWRSTSAAPWCWAQPLRVVVLWLLCVGVGDRRGLVTLRRAAQPPKVFF